MNGWTELCTLQTPIQSQQYRRDEQEQGNRMLMKMMKKKVVARVHQSKRRGGHLSPQCRSIREGGGRGVNKYRAGVWDR